MITKVSIGNPKKKLEMKEGWMSGLGINQVLTGQPEYRLSCF